MSALIELQSVSKTFSSGSVEHSVLKGIDLQVKEGESVAILGPSGGGKSTLLSIIGLLDSASAGEYRLKGQLTHRLNRQQLGSLRNQHIGWVFQNFSLIGSLTAQENVALPLRYNQDVSSKDYASLSEAMLEKVGLGDKLHALPSQLSGGQQQRVAIARALINQPALLLADEPTGNLDSESGAMIMTLLKECQSQGTTLVLVTHDHSLATVCDRQVQIRDGALTHAA